MALPKRLLDIPPVKLPELSPEATQFVIEHPNEATLAVGLALEMAAKQYPNLADQDVPAALRPFLVDTLKERDSDEMIGAAEAAQRLGISRASVYNWIVDKRLIAWNVTRQGVVIPAEQIIGRREVVAGIPEVVEEIGSARSAWRFLTEESPYFDTLRRPIEVLKEGDLKSVLDAARSHGDSFT